MTKLELAFPEKKQLTFPLYAMETTSKSIVKFISMNVGFIFYEGNGSWQLGEKVTDWHNCDNEEYWKILPKGTEIKITI